MPMLKDAEPEQLTPRQRALEQLRELKNQRTAYAEYWEDILSYTRPRRGRFNSSAANRDQDAYRRGEKIINSTAAHAGRTLSAGMVAGITSPARPWFRLTTPDPRSAQSDAVKRWLHEVEEIMRLVFSRSNLYQGLHGVYMDIGDIGITAMLIEEDEEDIVRAFVLPPGQYYLSIGTHMRVEGVYRELALTVRQMKAMFGLEACSDTVQDLWRQRKYHERVDVLHVIERNDSYVEGRIGPEGKEWSSCWYEVKGQDDPKRPFLRKGGYDEFPIVAPRWEINDEDVYGADCPGMMAHGDNKALQLYEKRKAELIDKTVRPPMVGPSSMRTSRISLLPGDMNFVDAHNSAQQFRPAIDINPAALQAVELSIREHEGRINRSYYADLWLALLNEQRQMTAREVSERHEEKMLQLGPVLERLQDELLDPLIDRVFAILWRQGMIPDPPEELQGMKLRVEYISIMAQAQKMLGTSSIERLAGFVGSVAAVVPEAVDNLDVDKLISEYAAALGVKPDLVRAREAVEALRKARQKAQQQAVQMEQAQSAAQGAKTLSETKLDEGDNALRRIINGVAPTATA